MSEPRVYYVPDEILDLGHASARPAERFEKVLIEKSAYDALAERLNQTIAAAAKSTSALAAAVAQAERERDRYCKQSENYSLELLETQQERDQLRERVRELEALWEQCKQGCSDYRKNNAALRAQCGDFREALEKIVYSRRDGVMPTAVRRIAREILSKHAKSNGGEK